MPHHPRLRAPNLHRATKHLATRHAVQNDLGACSLIVFLVGIINIAIWGVYALMFIGTYEEWTVATYVPAFATPIAVGFGFFLVAAFQEDFIVPYFFSALFCVMGATSSFMQATEMFEHRDWNTGNVSGVWHLSPATNADAVFQWESVTMFVAAFCGVGVGLAALALFLLGVIAGSQNIRLNMSSNTFVAFHMAGLFPETGPPKKRCDMYYNEYRYYRSQKLAKSGALVCGLLIQLFSLAYVVTVFAQWIYGVSVFDRDNLSGFYAPGPGDDFWFAFVVAIRIMPLAPMYMGDDDMNHRSTMHFILLMLALSGFGIFFARFYYVSQASDAFANSLNYFSMFQGQPFLIGSRLTILLDGSPKSQAFATNSYENDGFLIAKIILGIMFVITLFAEFVVLLVNMMCRRPKYAGAADDNPEKFEDTTYAILQKKHT